MSIFFSLPQACQEQDLHVVKRKKNVALIARYICVSTVGDISQQLLSKEKNVAKLKQMH